LAHAVITQIRSKPELLVGLYRVCPLILQMVGTDLVKQTDTSPFLAQVKDEPSAFGGDPFERLLQLEATVTTEAEQGIPRQSTGSGPATSPKVNATCSLPDSLSSNPCMVNTP